MVDSAHRDIILRRRMAFLTGALVVVGGCDEAPPPKAPPTPVTIEDSPGTPLKPNDTPPEPAPPKIESAYDTAIPPTDCAPDRDALLGLKKIYDEAYAEADRIVAALPSCAITDTMCAPNYELVAKRVDALQNTTFGVLGRCGCSAPIVSDYAAKHTRAVYERIEHIRERVRAGSADPDAANTKWEELLRKQATPRPCLSCVACESKSACD
jgi:hypothetical protein